MVLFVDVALDHRRRAQFALLADGQHPQRGALLAFVARPAVRLDERVLDDRDIAQREPGAVRVGPQHQLLELRARVDLPLGPQQDVAARGTYRPARHVDRGSANRLRDLAHRQPVLAQDLLGYLDADLVGPIAENVDGVHFGDAKQLLADFIGHRLAGIGVQIAGHRQEYDVQLKFLLVDDRLFCQSRKRRDRVDPRLDLGQDFIDVGVGRKFDADGAHALVRRGIDLDDARDVLDRLLDLDDDALFDFLRRRAEVGHADDNLVDLEVRGRLLADRER